jgi:Zn-dependent protease
MSLVAMFIGILFAISVHEAAHGWMADKRGDPTAKLQGRITLNPIPHIDLVGSILVPIGLIILSKLTGSLFIFGWAKPVPVNPYNLKNPRKDHMWIAAAGPLSNLLTAVIGIILFLLFKTMILKVTILAVILINLITISVVLAVLNLIPIPPLDGSHIIEGLLQGEALRNYQKIKPYGFIILIVLLYVGVLDVILHPIFNLVYRIILGG